MQVMIIVSLSQHAIEYGVKTAELGNLPTSNFSPGGSIHDDEKEAISK